MLYLYDFLFYRVENGEITRVLASTVAHSIVEAMSHCGVTPSVLIQVWRNGEVL